MMWNNLNAAQIGEHISSSTRAHQIGKNSCPWGGLVVDVPNDLAPTCQPANVRITQSWLHTYEYRILVWNRVQGLNINLKVTSQGERDLHAPNANAGKMIRSAK